MNKKGRYTALAFIMVIVSFLLSTGVSLLSLSLVVHNNVKDIDTILAKAAWSSEPLEDGFTHIAADLNGLKKANDNFGHDAGDELIKGAATHSEFPDESLEGLVRISDDRMYAAKAAYYRRSGQQPR